MYKALMKVLLDTNPSIVVNARIDHPDIRAPKDKAVKGSNVIVLRFGHDLSPPIRELSLDPLCISGYLSFDGKLQKVVIPWDAIVAAYTPGGEITTVFEKNRFTKYEESTFEVEEEKRPHLKLVD